LVRCYFRVREVRGDSVKWLFRLLVCPIGLIVWLLALLGIQCIEALNWWWDVIGRKINEVER